MEIRFPVSPSRGLVLSWLDEPDLIRSRAWAGDQENFNYATRAQAQQQWFSRPRSVIRISESEYPLLTQRIRRYDRRAVEQSPRRRKVLEIITDKIEHDAKPGELAIVELRPPDAG